MTKLSVNVNKIALLRNARHGEVPSVVGMAELALQAGAHGVTVHPRPDERHIRRYDVDACAELLASPPWHGREFNIEGNPLLPHFLPILRAVRPTQATLVPDDPGQTTSDHGFALRDPGVVASLRPIVAELQDLGCRVSLFVDPDPEVAAAAAADTGADRVELYTESYAKAYGTVHHPATFERFARSAERARAAGLGVNAGHDLNLRNLGDFLGIPQILEVSIGHALVADALELGMRDTVKRYLGITSRVG